MALHNFKYYLHETANRSETIEFLTDQGLPVNVAKDIAELRPFYEIEFDCTYDDITAVLTYTAK
jgi:hypothetical protein